MTCQADQLQGYTEHASNRIFLASSFLSLWCHEHRKATGSHAAQPDDGQGAAAWSSHAVKEQLNARTLSKTGPCASSVVLSTTESMLNCLQPRTASKLTCLPKRSHTDSTGSHQAALSPATWCILHAGSSQAHQAARYGHQPCRGDLPAPSVHPCRSVSV